jgi:hypothetical protein
VPRRFFRLRCRFLIKVYLTPPSVRVLKNSSKSKNFIALKAGGLMNWILCGCYDKLFVCLQEIYYLRKILQKNCFSTVIIKKCNYGFISPLVFYRPHNIFKIGIIVTS